MADTHYRLVDLEVHEVSLVEKPANPDARVVLFKSAEAPADKAAPPSMKCPKCGGQMAGGKCSKCGYMAPKEKSEMTEQKTETPVPEPKSEVTKAEFEAVSKALKDLQDKLAAKEQANVELEKKLAEETRVRKVKDSVARVAKEFSHLPAKADELGTALLTIAEKASDASKVIEDVLAKCEESIAKSPLFKQVGKSEAPANSATAEFDQLVAKAMADDKSLSKYAAEVRVINQNPELYGRMNAESRPNSVGN